MGMDSPQLLLFVENCPKGAETLVTRVIHILTDKGIVLQASSCLVFKKMYFCFTLETVVVNLPIVKKMLCLVFY